MPARAVAGERIPFPHLENEGSLHLEHGEAQAGVGACAFDANTCVAQEASQLAIARSAPAIIEGKGGADQGGGHERQRKCGEFYERINRTPVGEVRRQARAAHDGASRANGGGSTATGQPLASFLGLSGEVVLLIDNPMLHVVIASGFEGLWCGTVFEAQEQQVPLKRLEARQAERREGLLGVREGPELKSGADELRAES